MLTQKEYRDHPALSQSRVKDIIGYRFKSSVSESPSMLLGSIVDTLLEGETLLDERYTVISAKVGDKPKAIADTLFHRGLPSLDAVSDELLFFLFEEAEYNNRYKDARDPRRKEAFLADASDYFDALVQSIGKQVVAAETIEQAKQVATSIKTGRFTRQFFTHGLDHYPQLAIIFNIGDTQCKALVDDAIANNTEETIIFRGTSLELKPGHVLPIDYKTMNGHTAQFEKPIRAYRYDIQGAFYKEALTQQFPNHLIDNMVFIVGSTTDLDCPFVYQLSDRDEYIGKNGALKAANGWEPAQEPTLDMDIYGYTQGIELYKKHLFYDEWDYSINQLENGYLVTNSYR